MKMHARVGLAVLALAVLPAHSTCTSVEALKDYGKQHFKAIDSGSDTPGDSFRNSKFTLPYATSSFLYFSSPRLSTYQCTWRVAKGLKGKVEAQRTYEALVQSLLPCVGRPETLERFQVLRKQGERSSMLDSVPGMKSTQQRAFEVSYGYSNYWWSVELEYEVNDEVQP